MLQIYTGDGKGKTTAALGLALRAWGHGFNTALIQFMKGSGDYGEILATRNLPGIAIHQFGTPDFVKKGSPSEKDIQLAKEGLDFAFEVIKSRNYDIIILDELSVAIDFDLVPLQRVLELLDTVPDDDEIIITGRNAPAELIERADLVTEMKMIKHYYEKGIQGREGIEF